MLATPSGTLTTGGSSEASMALDAMTPATAMPAMRPNVSSWSFWLVSPSCFCMSSSALKKSLSSHRATCRARGRTLPHSRTAPDSLPAVSIAAVGVADAAHAVLGGASPLASGAISEYTRTDLACQASVMKTSGVRLTTTGSPRQVEPPALPQPRHGDAKVRGAGQGPGFGLFSQTTTHPRCKHTLSVLN